MLEIVVLVVVVVFAGVWSWRRFDHDTGATAAVVGFVALAGAVGQLVGG